MTLKTTTPQKTTARKLRTFVQTNARQRRLIRRGKLSVADVSSGGVKFTLRLLAF